MIFNDKLKVGIPMDFSKNILYDYSQQEKVILFKNNTLKYYEIFKFL